jgi:hypothetical protein
MIPTLQRLLCAGQALMYGDSRGRRGCALNPRVIMALLIIGGTLVYHWLGTTEYQNEFTGRTQTARAGHAAGGDRARACSPRRR